MIKCKYFNILFSVYSFAVIKEINIYKKLVSNHAMVCWMDQQFILEVH